MDTADKKPKRYSIVSGALFAAAVLFVIDLILWLAWAVADYAHASPEVLKVLTETAIVFGITAIITSIFESIALRRLAQEIEDHTKNQTTKLSQDISPIISAANDTGLERIFLTRLSSRGAIRNELDQIKKDDLVQVLGIALPEFFHREGPYTSPIEEILKRKATVQIILMNPDGEAANERQSIEGRHPKELSLSRFLSGMMRL